MDLPDTLHRLAAAHSIATEFWDWQGRHVQVSDRSITRVLEALGVDVATPDAAEQALRDHDDAPWRRLLPPALVIRAGWAPTVNVHVRDGAAVDVWIELEGGGYRSSLVQEENWAPARQVGDRWTGQATFRIPGDLPLGYHRLKAWSEGDEASCALIVTPQRVGLPERLGDRRAWGIATQLYSVRSAGSWGVGDVVDLEDLSVWGADLGAGYVLINPLHAAEPSGRMEPSPYLPTTRRFQNPIYLRVERIPEYADLPAADRAEVGSLKAALQQDLAGLDAIDRDTTWTAKAAALRLVHAVPRSAGRELAYAAYREREGEGLDNYATWCALTDRHGKDWHEWPDELQHPATPEVLAFRAEHADDVDFYRWLQFVLDEQLSIAQAATRRSGMALGVMHDLAVGVHPEGSDSWSLQDVFAQGITVGAPPDAFNQAGQDWAQPPWRPDRLAEQGYAPFRDMVRTVLRAAGGVRVDHIIGLFRLWWIPDGMGPTEGTYVRYDHEALIGILALEASRSGAIVVGEDLGTVEPWVREYLSERGILGTSILWFEFEFDGDGRPLRPERWREYCLASVTTHDLPPTAGYLAGDHVRLRDELGLLTRSLEEELAADDAERAAWIEELRQRGALTAATASSATGKLDPDSPDLAGLELESTVQALHRYLTWTPSKLLCVALTDMVGDRRTQNQPGTIDEYPNWRVPLTGPDGAPMSLEQVFVSSRARRLAQVVNES
ncbi:4-alpha-glucanotransferase [Nakamurella multipartita]|uniref:4-alpha-glucanotransferase n=1 Tax=Nakamurella multipartita (strain ATCC 700099 / DSM 44233 / CIP 104796 / JCM 9543 / NBRC 105858 / Y-104) TaxID=479431 RepID=C8X9W1_NAKMY|nr:4-alpha-glucanotransferase [Nakamurella multipartita]ACV81161.1 4-alpha-glucanotransferase [Nakamurella multipartita DSM 44233]